MEKTTKTESWLTHTSTAGWYYDRSPLKVASKSTTTDDAKSWQLAITTALEAVEVAALGAGHGGMDVYYMAVSDDAALRFIAMCAKWVCWLGPVADALAAATDIESTEFEKEDGSRILAYRIDFPSGFSIYALPSRPARLRGKQGLAICDEAAQQDLEAWLTAAGGLLIWGGRLIVISDHDGAESAFTRLVDDMRRGDRPGSLHEV